jgi:hypothetical protein
VCQRDRLARSRAWQEHRLTDSIDEHELDSVLWHCTQTAAARCGNRRFPCVVLPSAGHIGIDLLAYGTAYGG